MATDQRPTVRELLLTRRGLAFLSSTGDALPEDCVRAVELELADLGYVMSSRLRARLARSSRDELIGFRAWAVRVLLAHVGGDREHTPLFRHFPENIPDDTRSLWWTKVLVHFLQGAGQPCLFCRRIGTTHVLSPCQHVVCDHCFDGTNYSACPVCEHHVDRDSPFFQPTPARGLPAEKVIFKLLDLGGSVTDEAKALFVSLCARKQALSSGDRDVLVTVVSEYKEQVLSWLPAAIPVRENVAIVFATVFQSGFQSGDPAPVIRHGRRFLQTATDVLRVIAVLSGTDGSLMRETVYKTVEHSRSPNRFLGRIAKVLGVEAPTSRRTRMAIPVRVCRFKTAKLSRPLRRALLAILDGMHPDSLVEDMLRHRSYWVWVGEFLHPHEYAARFPNVARGFQIVRKKAPDGTPAPRFYSWYARLAQAVAGSDTDALLALCTERPGEFARRVDHMLRSMNDDDSRARVVAAFVDSLPAMATPVLVTLRSHLPTRLATAAVRIYWPKGRVAKGVSSPDNRAVLPRQVIEPTVRAIDCELLARFSAQPPFADCVIDDGLRTVIVPFNERTASKSAVSLPRGSRVPVAQGDVVRLFLHWCQPADNGWTTDLDLSIGLYDDAWQYVGVCSYYQLQAKGRDGALIAQSAGDLQDAPWPDGATEFVDLHRVQALAAGVRYAVMVVNAYAGMPFGRLERAFAGLMLRDDPGAAHFDPRTVALKFTLDGDKGVFLPLVLDVRDGMLHWLDVHAKGQFEMNTVATSNAAITKICPELMTYFASGVRASMFDLGLLHAAARCQRVFVRGPTMAQCVRRPGEAVQDFHQRLVRGEYDEPRSQPPRTDGPPLLAILYRGDLALPAGSSAYALFREQVTPSLAASDLLS